MGRLDNNKQTEVILNYFSIILIVWVIAFICGVFVQKRADKAGLYNIETCNLLFDQYEQALRIAGSHYENYVLDVYCEGDNYEDSLFQAEYERYLAARDSINNIWESNH